MMALTPAEQVEYEILLRYVERDRERERCEDSLIEFFKAAWTHMGEAGEPVINWHHEVIAHNLVLVAFGKQRALVINQPPRTTKPVDENAMILTSLGPTPLRDIAPGDQVLTHMGRYRPVLEVHEQGALPVLKISTFAGREVKAALDHPFLTTDGWVEARNLIAGRHVLAATSPYLGEDRGEATMSAEAARFLGYLIGDGSVKYVGITFTGLEEDVLDDFERCAKALGFGTRRRAVAGCKCPVVGVNSNRDGSLQRFLKLHGLAGKDSYTKTVPDAVQRGNREVIGNFLGAFATCDGHFKIRAHVDGRLGHQAKMTTVSRELAYGLQHLCLRLGMSLRVRTRRTKMETKRQPGGVYTSYDVQTTDQHTVSKFRALPGLCERKRLAIAGAFPLQFDTHLFPDPVIAVETDGKIKCRCLSVEEDYSFTANDLAVHNSLLCSVAFPAWLWSQPEERWGPLMGPHVRFLCASYGATLAQDLALKMRRLVMGEWYQERWGDRVQIRDDQAARDNFANTKGGERLSYSVEGGVLGRGGDIQILDDVHHIQGAESETQRRATLEAMRNLVTRVTDPRRAARIMVMQRLHEDDATNYALENWDNPRHLMLPMRFDTTRADPEDPRERDGQLLWPEVWTEKLVRQEERELQEYGSSGQLQQSPVPRGGGIIKREWWRLWPDDADKEGGRTFRYRCGFCAWEGSANWAGSRLECQSCGSEAERVIEYPATSFRLLSVDTNYGDKEINSWSAATMWGVWHDADDAPRLMLMEAWRGRPKLRTGSMSDKGLVERIYDMTTRRNVDTVLIERKTRGQDLYDELDRLTREYPFRLEFFEPTGRGDKVARLNAVVPLFTNDLVWAPDKKWAELVISEVNNQPFDKFDDLADTCSSALAWLRANGHLSLKHEHMKSAREALFFRGRSGRFDAGELYEGA